MAPGGCTFYFIAPLALCMFTAIVFSYAANDIRLVGGSMPNEGRIEVFMNGAWNTICSNRATWTIEKSQVVCRQLGYAGHMMEKYNAYFGEGNGSAINDPLNCSGVENHVKSCPLRQVAQDTFNCDHSQDMSIICRLPSYLGCHKPDLNITRLVTIEVNGSFTVVTPFNCIKSCAQINMTYTVVMTSGCRCIESSVWGFNKMDGDSGACAEACPNNDLYVCGGHSNVDIYKTADIICPDPGIPENGDRRGDRFYFGDNVLFSCQEGYSLVGESTMQCVVGRNNTVEWNSSVPLCNLDLVSDPDTTVSSTEASFGSPTIAEYLHSDEARSTDFNGGTTNLMASSDVTMLTEPANPTTSTLGYLISLTSTRAFPLSQINSTVAPIKVTPTRLSETSKVTEVKLTSPNTNQPSARPSTISSFVTPIKDTPTRLSETSKVTEAKLTYPNTNQPSARPSTVSSSMTPIKDTPNRFSETSKVTEAKLTSLNTNHPSTRSSTVSNSVTSESTTTLEFSPDHDSPSVMSTPPLSSSPYDKPEKELTTATVEEGTDSAFIVTTIELLPVTTIYHTSMKKIQTTKGMIAETSGASQGGPDFRILFLLLAVVILLTILLALVMIVICCRRRKRKKPIFRVVPGIESDIKSSFVFSRGSDSYKKFGEHRYSASTKPDIVTTGTTFGYGDGDTTNRYQNRRTVFVEPGYEQMTEHPSEKGLSHPEAVEMFRQSKGDMYNQFDFEIPTNNELTKDQEEFQFPSSFREDDFIKQSTV